MSEKRANMVKCPDCNSTTSAYSSTGHPDWPDCPLPSHPTTAPFTYRSGKDLLALQRFHCTVHAPQGKAAHWPVKARLAMRHGCGNGPGAQMRNVRLRTCGVSVSRTA